MSKVGDTSYKELVEKYNVQSIEDIYKRARGPSPVWCGLVGKSPNEEDWPIVTFLSLYESLLEWRLTSEEIVKGFTEALEAKNV